MKIVKREVVEQTAKIMGEYSACGEALKEAEKYENPVFFKLKDSLYVTSKETFDKLIKQENRQ